MVVRVATGDLVARLNLRTYGWADHFVYGRTQKVLTDLRARAKRRPMEVPHPQPPRQVLTEDADPHDSGVGVEHLKRGWPRGLWYEDAEGGRRFMAYHVVDPDDPRVTYRALTARSSQGGRRHGGGEHAAA